MKYAILVLQVLFLLSYGSTVKGQCTPDISLTEFGAFSSLGKNKIPSAWIDSTYNEVLTLVVPATFLGVSVNKITLKDVPDLYSGLTYDCNPSTCIFSGGTNGCILIKDKATDKGQVNRESVTLELFIESSLVNFDTSISVEFRLLDSVSLSIVEQSTFEKHFYPNPAKDILNVDFNEVDVQKIPVELFDLNGKLIKETTFENSSGTGTIAIHDLTNGVYFLKYEIDDEPRFEKISIDH